MEKNELSVLDGRSVSSEELEKAENELRVRTKALFKQVETTYWELGQALYDIYDGVPGGYRELLKGEGARAGRVELFKKWGYTSFEDYCEREIGILRRSASSLRYAYYWFEVHLGLPREIKDQVKALGRSKVYLLAGFVTMDNVMSWLEKAKEMTHDELKKVIKTAKALASGDPGDQEEKDSLISSNSEGGLDENGDRIAPAPESTHTLTTSLFDGQWNTWQQALGRAKSVTSSDKIGHNLEMICLDFLANNSFADPKEDLKRYIAKVEQITGKKIIAIDPQSGSPVYGGDLLWMLVKEKAAADSSSAEPQEQPTDISVALSKKRKKKLNQKAEADEETSDQLPTDEDGPPSF